MAKGNNFSVKMGGRTTLIKPFPISIAFTLKDYDNNSPKIKPSQLLNEHGITSPFMGTCRPTNQRLAKELQFCK
jgi:hypothetical protein